MTPSAADSGVRTHLVLNVPAFERVELRDPVNEVHLDASPAAHHGVVVEGPPEMLGRIRAAVDDGVLRLTIAGSVADRVRDAVTTSLARRHLVYRIRAPQLLEVGVAGFVHVSVDAFGADAPVVTRLVPQVPLEPTPPWPPR